MPSYIQGLPLYFWLFSRVKIADKMEEILDIANR